MVAHTVSHFGKAAAFVVHTQTQPMKAGTVDPLPTLVPVG